MIYGILHLPRRDSTLPNPQSQQRCIREPGNLNHSPASSFLKPHANANKLLTIIIVRANLYSHEQRIHHSPSGGDA